MNKRVSPSYWGIVALFSFLFVGILVYCLKDQADLNCLTTGKTIWGHVVSVDHLSKDGIVHYSYDVDGTRLLGNQPISLTSSFYRSTAPDKIEVTYCSSNPSLSTASLSELRRMQSFHYSLVGFSFVASAFTLFIMYRRDIAANS